MATRTQITVTLGGKGDRLTPRDLITALRETIIILQKLDRRAARESGGKERIKWQIGEVKKNSPLTMELIGTLDSDGRRAEQVVGTFVRGVSMAYRQKTHPSDWPRSTVGDVRNISRLLENGVHRIAYALPNQDSVELISDREEKQPVQSNKVRYATTELRGRLSQITARRRKTEFCIDDPATGRHIKCRFDKTKVKEVAGLIACRVAVYGRAKYDHEHRLISIDVVRWKQLREQSQLPQLRDLHAAGIRVTHQDPADAIRDLRDGE